MFQDYARFHLTAQENIWFGYIDLAPGQKRIAAVARLSGADEVIVGLPRGYETVLSRRFEDGEEPSVGGWQCEWCWVQRAKCRRGPVWTRKR
jgi:ATP-binding cassette subfamily B protein